MATHLSLNQNHSFDLNLEMNSCCIKGLWIIETFGNILSRNSCAIKMLNSPPLIKMHRPKYVKIPHDVFIKILVGWSGCVYRTKTQTHNGKMETKLLYQQSGCDVKRTSQIRTTQNIVFEQSRNRWGGRVFISISLSLQLFSRFWVSFPLSFFL